MSGSNEWDAHIKGNAPENKWNFSYRPAMMPSDSVDIPPQMQQSTNKLVLPASTNKVAPLATKATNKATNKRNQLPPLPSMAVIRGGKRKSSRSRSRSRSRKSSRSRRSKTHKKSQHH